MRELSRGSRVAPCRARGGHSRAVEMERRGQWAVSHGGAPDTSCLLFLSLPSLAPRSAFKESTSGDIERDKIAGENKRLGLVLIILGRSDRHSTAGRPPGRWQGDPAQGTVSGMWMARMHRPDKQTTWSHTQSSSGREARRSGFLDDLS